jgi:hypothetical protein
MGKNATYPQGHMDAVSGLFIFINSWQSKHEQKLDTNGVRTKPYLHHSANSGNLQFDMAH